MTLKRNFLLCAALSFSVSCARVRAPHHTESVPKAFAEKYANYIEWSKGELDEYGFARGCDGLLFTGLYVSAGSDVSDYTQAEDPGSPGRWYRNAERTCGVNGESGSTISRDMLLGLAKALWHRQDVENAKEVLLYAENNNFKMGDGDLSRVMMSPSLYATFQAIVAKAPGSTVPMPPRVENPDPNAGEMSLTQESADALLIQTGYRAHLTVVHIYLRGLIYGGITELEMRILKAQAERQPRNALYRAVYQRFSNGRQDEAIKLLMDEAFFPSDRLPSTAEYCTDYLYQRDDLAKDWAPCPEEIKSHNGIDWLFAASVVLNAHRRAN